MRTVRRSVFAMAFGCVLSVAAAERVAVTGVESTSARADVSDAERARAAVRRGEYVPLEQIVADAQERYPGRVIEVELEDEEYEIELLTEDGVRVELEYDARTGRLLEVEYDD